MTETTPQTPADRVIAAFADATGHNGEVNLARACGLRSPATVFRWKYPRDKGGTGGLIPANHHARILAAAEARGIGLKADDLVDWSAVAAAKSTSDAA